MEEDASADPGLKVKKKKKKKKKKVEAPGMTEEDA